MQLGLNGEDLDIDLLVYGSTQFNKLIHILKSSKAIQKKLWVSFQSKERIVKNAIKYQSRHNCDWETANYISKNRTRFSLNSANGTMIKMGINSNYERGKHNGLTILGSKFIKKVNLTGKIVDSTDACVFPRQYQLKTNDGKYFIIASHHWGHQLLVQKGDKITVSGNLRETAACGEIVFLECDKDYFKLDNSRSRVAFFLQ